MRAPRAPESLAAAIAVLAFATTAVGAPLSDIPAAFVDTGVGAASMGMAGAVVASVRGADAVFWNPASLGAGGLPREISASYCDQMGLVPYSAASGAFRLGSGYSVGAGVLYSGDDVLTEGTAVAAVARELPAPPWCGTRRAAVGASVRGRWASFGQGGAAEDAVSGSALGVGLDVGAVVPLTTVLTLGVTGRDIANALTWDSSSRGSYGEAVPSALVAGVAGRPMEHVLVEVDLEKALRADANDVVSAGASVTLFGVAVLRGGYRRPLAPDDFEEFAVGGGALARAGSGRIAVDAAYLFGRLENTLRLSVGFGF